MNQISRELLESAAASNAAFHLHWSESEAKARRNAPIFTDDDLRSFMESGGTQSEAARHFGVTPAAICKRLKRARGVVKNVPANAPGVGK